MLTHVWSQVLAFFAKLGMPLPERPPLLLVDSESLGNAREKEGDCSHDQPPGTSPAPISGPVMHTRGLCLWQVRHTLHSTAVFAAVPASGPAGPACQQQVLRCLRQLLKLPK